jgi:hypothetical protein
MATSNPQAQVFTGDINIPPSPVPHLFLHPNTPPSEYESALIRSAILDSESSLSQLESRLTAVLREFRQKRKALRRYSQVHQRLLSRKSHIPPEILSSIFTLCLPSNWKDCHVEAQAIPVLLSHVSVYWRHVAISTPRLWSSMYILLRSDLSDCTINMFETWLSRTSGTLLSVEIVSYFSSVEAEQPVTHPILEMILSCCHRWQRFIFKLPISLSRSLFAVKDKLPCLESLSPHYYPQSNQLSPFWNTFQSAPRLTDLTLSGPYTIFSKLAVPWTQLTKFQTGMDWDDVIKLLHHLPNLVEFVFFCCKTPSTTRPLVQLPHLATLIIDADDDPANLFDCLVIPCLRNVDISLYYYDGQDDDHTVRWDWPEPFLSLIFRSACSIQSFTLNTRAIDFDVDDLTRCLHAMPALRDLRLQLILYYHYDIHNFFQDILCRLIHRSAEPCIVPKLTYLDFYFHSRDVPVDNLIDMVQSRWRTVDNNGDGVSDKPTLDVARLQVVILRNISPRRNSDLRTRLRELKDEGMRIELWDHQNERVTF